jgi:sialic acid synthase SpsE
MVRRVREAEKESGDQLIRGLSDEFGDSYVEKTLGDGIKKMADAESAYYYTSNRSIIARRTLLPGDKLNPDNFALLRSEQQNPPGLPPQFVSTITGRQIKKRVPVGSGITWDHLL